MLMPSQVAPPSGTIAIATGIAPEVCITGSVAPRTTITLLVPIPAPAELAPVEPMPAIELVVVVAVVIVPLADFDGLALPLSTWANRTTATITTAIAPPITADRAAP